MSTYEAIMMMLALASSVIKLVMDTVNLLKSLSKIDK